MPKFSSINDDSNDEIFFDEDENTFIVEHSYESRRNRKISAFDDDMSFDDFSILTELEKY
jgi:hypothetical protein